MTPAIGSAMPLGLGPNAWVLLGGIGCLAILAYTGYMFANLRD